jgi:hypothetical protein
VENNQNNQKSFLNPNLLKRLPFLNELAKMSGLGTIYLTFGISTIHFNLEQQETRFDIVMVLYFYGAL